MSDPNQPPPQPPQHGGYPPQPPNEPPRGPGGGPEPWHGQGPHQPHDGGPDDKGFFAALFDFSFRSFVTLKFAKIIYILLIALVVLGWLMYIAIGFATEPMLGVAALVFGWIPGFIFVVLFRVSLEFYIAMIRTSQNTAATKAEVEQLRGDLTAR
ncbi:hypothetical protein GCM10022377_19710 [Zhihengliuella alba]|uniref:DUF4282 domain-containing protein n=1 Tax=Zhihengliuella alba TaxID=547018 RepID=A0ABP7DJ89_9MICC